MSVDQAGDGGHDHHQGDVDPVFLHPITLAMTSMLGRLKRRTGEQQRERRALAHAGAEEPSRIGTSVSVAKYMNAPATEAKRFAPSALPPTAASTQPEGIRPS